MMFTWRFIALDFPIKVDEFPHPVNLRRDSRELAFKDRRRCPIAVQTEDLHP